MGKLDLFITFAHIMKATIPFVEQKFKEFNRLIFGDRLPMIPIKLSNAATFMGMCTFRVKRNLLGRKSYTDFTLKISTRFEQTEKELEDIIIHEMIHYFIHYHKLEDRSAHGPLFRKMMNDINLRYGRHLSISHKTTAAQKEEALNGKRQWRVVAVVVFHNAKIGVKVLPRIKERIVNYRDKVSRSKEVTSVTLFISNDPFFNRFPCSSVLKAHYIDEEELRKHLMGAKKVEIGKH